MGGNLEEAAFIPLAKKAEYLVKSQASGRTGDRIAKLAVLPECIKECVFALVSFFDGSEKQISSESQSQGGQSESYSYVTKTEEELKQAGENIIIEYLYGGGFGYLLYKGAAI